MAATKLDEALLIELGISDDRLNRELARAYAKAIRDNRKLEAELDRVTNGAVERMGDSFERMGMDAQRSTRVATAGVVGLGAAMSRARPQIQNAAFQVGDFATQLASGTRASTALAQQLPQMLGGFGAVGAVMGAAVAVALPLASSFITLGEEARTAEERAQALSDAVNNFVQASEAANLSSADLAEKYGSLAIEARAALQAIVGAEQLAAFAALQQEAQALGETLSQFFSFAENSVGGLDLIVDMEGLAAATQLTTSQAQLLNTMLSNLASSDDLAEVGRRAAELQHYMESAYGSVEQMPDSMATLYRSLAEMVVQAGLMQGAIESAESAAASAAEAGTGLSDAIRLAAGGADLLAAALSAAQAPAAGLLGQMQSLAAAAWEAAQAMAMAQSPVSQSPMIGGVRPSAGDIIGTQDQRGAIIRAQMQIVRNRAAQTVGATGSAGGGGGGGADQQSDALRQAEQLFDQTRTAAERYAEQVAEIDQLLADGLISEDTHARALEQVRQRYEEADEAMQQYRRSMERGIDAVTDFFGSIVDRSQSARDAIADLLMQMAKVQMFRGFSTLATSSGPVGSLFGALGDALTMPSFAGGGFTGGGGRVGGLDGLGGFPAILHPNETVIDHATGGRGPGPTLTFHIDARGASADAAPAIEAAMRRMAPQIVQQAVAASGRAMRATKSFGGAR